MRGVFNMSTARQETDKQLAIQSTLEGVKVEIRPGFSVPEAWQELQKDFRKTEEVIVETRYWKDESGETKGYLIYGFDVDREIERILVLGKTASGYLASPQLIFERAANNNIQVVEINLKRAHRELEIEPWKMLVGQDKDDILGMLELFVSGDGWPHVFDKVQVGFPDYDRRKELFERWGIKFPIQTFNYWSE